MRVCGYMRTGTAGDGGEGSAIEEQRRLLSELSEAQGYPVQAWFVDEGVDGLTEFENRPAVPALLKSVQEGTYHAVAVLRLDRLGRSAAVVDGAIQAVSDAGGHVRVLTT